MKCLSRPKRARARSSSYDNTNASGDTVRKRSSFPRTVEDVRCSMSRGNFGLRGAQSPEVKRIVDPRCRIVGSESLRTLLQMQHPNVVDAVQFVPTVTVGNAAKSLAELAIATPVSFSCLPIASVRPLTSDHYVKSPTEVVLDADHNHINAHPGDENSLSPEKKQSAISFHDDENNMETVDARWVIDRIAHLRLKTDCTGKSQESLDLVPENIRPNPKKTHERCISMDEERMRSTLFDSFAQSSAPSSKHSASSPVENGVRGDQCSAKQSKIDSIASKNEVKGIAQDDAACSDAPEMDWILAVDVKVVC
ncbi:hypothetical protein TELCIR_06710 [Teladorsagia circumcincta]|uniref:Uncharacterized protein n=1 Tax=Teladorsagia circumcincta TaxID=45464 RepID=A0A2G9UNV2_TELCI|nr:hypothetical protein TELCIR_06710 [Teladorsagia circumcincta]